ncbi:MAG TPA: LPS export ABC transporter periplasmic protein LptC [Pseudorhodoplanes sp.]|jgi:lipopolysaccharide export system protein LptC|nr:LPS export ABC transporter periplasmic protein LptC [Pseudorhodoplanes sp.]
MSIPRDTGSGRAYAAPDFMGAGRDSTRAFQFAQRHSRRVRILRVAIPVGVAICFLVIVIATFFNPLQILYKLPRDIGTLVVSGTKITMEAPRLAGMTRDARVYEVTAKAAAQDISKPELIELKEIRAKLGMQDKSVMQMSAAGGLYNAKTEMLNLGPDIMLSSSSGYEGKMQDAEIDIRKGTIVSRQPVEVKMLKGNLNANGLEVLEAGDLIRFGGGVSMMLKLEPAEAAAGDGQ